MCITARAHPLLRYETDRSLRTDRAGTGGRRRFAHYVRSVRPRDPRSSRFRADARESIVIHGRKSLLSREAIVTARPDSPRTHLRRPRRDGSCLASLPPAARRVRIEFPARSNALVPRATRCLGALAVRPHVRGGRFAFFKTPDCRLTPGTNACACAHAPPVRHHARHLFVATCIMRRRFGTSPLCAPLDLRRGERAAPRGAPWKDRCLDLGTARPYH